MNKTLLRDKETEGIVFTNGYKAGEGTLDGSPDAPAKTARTAEVTWRDLCSNLCDHIEPQEYDFFVNHCRPLDWDGLILRIGVEKREYSRELCKRVRPTAEFLLMEMVGSDKARLFLK